MRLKGGKGKRWVPAHREYFLTLVRNNGKREPWYLPEAFATSEAAQIACNKRNPHYKHGQLVVDFVDRPGSYGYDLGSIVF